MRYGSIYQIQNNLNGKRYVGQTIFCVETRWKSHISTPSNSAIHQAITKYGKDNFTFTELCCAKTEKDLNELEEYFIKLFNSYGNTGYNMTLGGDASSGKFTDEVRLKMSLAKLGKKRGPRKLKDNANQSGRLEFKSSCHAQRLEGEAATADYNPSKSPRQPSKYITSKSAIIRLYKKHTSTHKVAELLALDRSQICAYLKVWGILKTKAESASIRNKRRYKLNRRTVNRIKALCELCNYNISKTSRDYKISKKLIYRALKTG